MDIHCSRPDFSLSHKQVNVFIAAVIRPSFSPWCVLFFLYTAQPECQLHCWLVVPFCLESLVSMQPNPKGPRGHGYQASSPPSGCKSQRFTTEYKRCTLSIQRPKFKIRSSLTAEQCEAHSTMTNSWPTGNKASVADTGQYS